MMTSMSFCFVWCLSRIRLADAFVGHPRKPVAARFFAIAEHCNAAIHSFGKKPKWQVKQIVAVS